MKNSIRKLTALVLVLAMVLSMSALAAKQTPSKGFRLPAVKPRVTEAPADASGAADAPAAPEVTEAPAAPEETQAPETEETPAPAEEETVIGSAYVSLEDASSTLNVRAAATTDSQRLGSLNHGDRVSVLGYEGEWTKIAYGSAFGFVKSSYLSASPAEEPVEEPVEEPTEEPVEEPVEEPTEEPVEEPTEEPVEEPTEEPVEEPTEEPTEEPVEEPTEVPVEEPTEEPSEEPTEEPVEEAIETPVTSGDADVRLEGDGLSEIIITLPEGTELIVLGVEGDWVKVEVDGQIGYIYKDSVLGVEFEEPELPEGEAPMPKVTIFSSRRTVVTPGETIVLTSKLENFEGYGELSFQWEYDRGNGFESVPGATEDTYSFEASIENLSYDWRLAVSCED